MADILLVEDDRAIVENLSELLKEEGWKDCFSFEAKD